MTIQVALALAILSASPEIYFGETEPVVMLVMTPKHASSQTETSRFLEAAGTALETKTSLRVVPTEWAGVDATTLRNCPAESRLSCWHTAITSRFDSNRKRPPYLLVLGVLPVRAGVDQLSTLFIDLSVAPGTTEDVMREHTLRTSSTEVASARPDALGRYFSSLVQQRFRGVLERTGHWSPYGTVEVECSRAGLEIAVDDTLVGLTNSGATRIAGILPGDRQIAVRDPRGGIATRAVRVETSQTARIQLEPVRPTHPLRSGLMWTGAAVAATGVAFGVYGLVAGEDLRVACGVRGSSGGCPTGGGPRLGGTTDLPNTSGTQVSGGVLVFPLSASLVAAGGAWFAGSKWWGDSAELPWLPALVGLAAGAVAYGVGAALDPQSSGGQP